MKEDSVLIEKCKHDLKEGDVIRRVKFEEGLLILDELLLNMNML